MRTLVYLDMGGSVPFRVHYIIAFTAAKHTWHGTGIRMTTPTATAVINNFKKNQSSTGTYTETGYTTVHSLA